MEALKRSATEVSGPPPPSLIDSSLCANRGKIDDVHSLIQTLQEKIHPIMRQAEQEDPGDQPISEADRSILLKELHDHADGLDTAIRKLEFLIENVQV